MKFVLPLALAVLGLGAGIGAGVALKPEPAPEEHAAADCPEPGADAQAEPADAHAEPGHDAAADCPTEAAAAPDPFAPVAPAKPKLEGEMANVRLEKPFIVPVFRDERTTAMIVASVAVEVGAEGVPNVEPLEPRLRDAFLAVMFRHANSGGFDGTFTEGRKMDDLKSALLISARTVLEEAHVPVNEVLITDIVRQDM